MQHLQKTGGIHPSSQEFFLSSRFLEFRTFRPSGVSACNGQRVPPISHLPYTLPSSVSRNFFICHSCENCRVCTLYSHSGTHRFAPQPITYVLSIAVPNLSGNFSSKSVVPISKHRPRAGQEASSHVRP